MPHKDPAVARAYHLVYKRENRWRFRRRQKSYDAAKHANERAVRYGVIGILTPEQVEAILAIGACFYCGSTEPITIDHFVPMDKGGPNLPSNLVPACGSCNKSKRRGSAPWRWSQEHDRCVVCGTIERPHLVHGRCTKCARRERSARDRAKRAAA